MSKNKDTLFPVFRIKPETTTRGQIKFVGTIKQHEKLIDETVELDLDKDNTFIDKKYYNPLLKDSTNTLYLGEILGYEITAKIHKCNLSGNFLIINTEYPIYYISFMYSKPIVSGNIFDYYLTFEIDKDDKNKLNKPSKYTNAYINGTFKFGININKKILNNYRELLQNKLFSDKDITEEINKKLDYYNYFFKPIIIDNINITPTNIKKTFYKIISDPKILDIIHISIESREEERLENAGIDLTKQYSVPKDEDSILINNNIESIKEKFADLLSL